MTNRTLKAASCAMRAARHRGGWLGHAPQQARFVIGAHAEQSQFRSGSRMADSAAFGT